MAVVESVIIASFVLAGLTRLVNARERGDQPGEPVQLTISSPQDAPFQTAGAQFAVSPDGSFLAFVATTGGQTALWVRPLGAGTATRLAGTEGASYPFWSADARSIGFFADEQLKTASAREGGATVLCKAPNGRGGSWSSDGTIIFTPSPPDPLFRVPSNGGVCRPTTRLAPETERSHRWPQFLPDGQHFIVLVTSNDGTKPTVGIGALDSPEVRSLGVQSDSSAMYSAGHILFMRDGVLLAVPLDVDTHNTTGETFPVAQRVRPDVNFHTGASVSSTGVLVFQQDSAPPTTRLTWMDRRGKVLRTIGEPGQYMNIELAPDERRVAVSLVSGIPENRDIWIIDGKTRPARLTSDPANDAVPLWARDGRSIVFESYRTGLPTVFRKAANRVGDEVQLLDSDFRDIPEDWSADGQFVIFARSAPRTYLDLWVLPLSGLRKPFPFLATLAAEDNARFDRTGQWVAYTSNASGRYEVYVRPFPRGVGEYRISREGGGSPMWRADGKELFFLTADGTLMAAVIDSRHGFRSGEPRALFRTGVSEIVTSGNRHQYAVSKDGQRFMINRADPHDDSPPLTAILDWPARQR